VPRPTTTTSDPGLAGRLREAMADTLVAGCWITSPVVEAAFRVVPRHEFVPGGTSLEVAYAPDLAPVAKSDDNGAHLSSVSAAWLQARMIAQAGIAPGMRVLEIGSGGYNAALLAEITGDGGHVVTLDIDPDITERATASLKASGHGDRVTVLTADGDHGAPGHGTFDAIIVTAGAWDLPPAWAAQLTGSGTLVVPMRMNTITRSIAFRRDGGHLVSTSAELCGFVPMQGDGARAERTFSLPGPDGGHVALRFENPPADPGRLDGVLGTGQVTSWSGITVGSAVPFGDLHLWLAGFLAGFCRVAASEGTTLHAEGVGKGWFPYGCALGDSFAYLACRKLAGAGPARLEFGAKAYGPHAHDAAGTLTGQIQAWDAHGRDVSPDGFTFWPAGTAMPPPPPATAVFPKAHGTVTVTWPA
jgi:protein-L-isoaspartate(D-aspartate) O-methyltransferase